MRTLLSLALVVVAAASCVPTDITGCPLDPLEAVGSYCPDNGQQCGEFSLCDPCTSDLSECELIECDGFAWKQFEPETTCDVDGGS